MTKLCKNKHTGAIAEYLREEYVKNFPFNIRVHILLYNGKEKRLNDESFAPHWTFITNPREPQ